LAYLYGLGIAGAAVIAASTYYIYRRSLSENSRYAKKIPLLSKAQILEITTFLSTNFPDYLQKLRWDFREKRRSLMDNE